MLTFIWPGSRGFWGPFVGFLGISAGMHALLFLLLQVVPEEKVTAPDREQEIQVLRDDLPEHRALLAAAEAESPLPALSYRLLSVEDLLLQPYRSVTSSAQEPPLEAARWKPPIQLLVPVLSSPATTHPVAPIPEREKVLREGKIHLSEKIKTRFEHTQKPPPAPDGPQLEAPVFLIGILPEGKAAYVLLQRSSGSEEADQLAEKTLRGLTFEARDGDIEWGEAVLEWSGPAR